MEKKKVKILKERNRNLHGSVNCKIRTSESKCKIILSNFAPLGIETSLVTAKPT